MLWVIPCSSKIEKYQNIIIQKEIKHKPHNHIQIVTVNGRKSALLYQDMFPIAPHYIDQPYSNATGIFEIRDKKTVAQIEANAHKIINLLRRGIKFTPTQPDVNRIEKIMLQELNDHGKNE